MSLQPMLLLVGCDQVGQGEDRATYTLYRESPIGPERVHVATFDADQSGDYNRENCFTARDLFAGQGVTVRYWCELGRYRAN